MSIKKRIVSCFLVFILVLSSFTICQASVITLPSMLQEIEEEAFLNDTSLTEVIVPEGTITIGRRAFSGCTNLESITLPESISNIGTQAFSNCPNLIIHGKRGTYAEEYAAMNSIMFIGLNDAPYNVAATLNDSDVTLTWDGETNAFVVYEIKDNARTFITVTRKKTWTITDVSDGIHHYIIRAAFYTDEGYRYLDLYSDDVEIDVSAQIIEPSSVSFTIPSSIVMGGTTQLTAEVLPSDCTDKSVVWSSSNTSVATVSSSGLVTGVFPGTAEITCTTNTGAKSATHTIEVLPGTEITPANGLYCFVSACGSKVMNVSEDINANGQNVELYTANNGNGQKFYITKASDGWYKIQTVLKEKTVDTASGSSGGNVRIGADSSSSSGMWKFYDAGNGYYYVRHKSGFYLDVQNALTDDETNIDISNFSASNALKWKLNSTSLASPKAASHITVTDITSFSAVVNWAPAASTLGTKYDVEVYRARQVDQWSDEPGNVEIIVSNITSSGYSIDLSGDDTIYYLRIRAYNDTGSVYSDYIRFNTPKYSSTDPSDQPPTAASNVSVTSIASFSVVVNWSPGKSVSGTTYDIEVYRARQKDQWSDEPGDVVEIIAKNVTSSGYTVYLTGDDTIYYLRIRAYNNTGSVYTDYVRFYTPKYSSGGDNWQTVSNWLSALIGTDAKEWGAGPGTQCVELPKYYIEKYYGCTCKSSGLGNGNDLYLGIANRFPDKFQAISYYDGIQLKPGDIISYHSATSPTKGHAAVVYAVEGNTYKIIEQWKDCGTVRTRTCTVKAPAYGVSYTIIGIARPK